MSGTSGFLGQELFKTFSFCHEVIQYQNLNRDKISYQNLKDFNKCDYFVHLAEPASDDHYTPEFCQIAFENAKVLSDFFTDKLIYASSVLVYGLGDRNPHREDAELNPFNKYTRHKVETELQIYSQGSRAMRISNVIGPKMNSQNLVNNLLRKIRNNEEIVVHSDDSRDFIDVRDASKLIMDVLEIPFKKVINIGSGTAVSISGVARELACQTGLVPQIKFLDKVPRQPHSCIPDISLLKLLNPDFSYTHFADSIGSIANKEKAL
jgi:nucleoside-diphosphate-sugar epimerase